MKKMVFFLLLNAVAGCSHMHGGGDMPESRAFIEKEIADAAKDIRADLALLSGTGIREGERGFTRSPALTQPVGFEFDGTLQGALEKLCAATGFLLEVRGTAPLRETAVHLRLKEAPAIHVFREIGTQCSPRERLTLLEERRTAVLEYGETRRNGWLGAGGEI